MVRKETRRIERGMFAGEVRLSWEQDGSQRFTKGTGRDLSSTGMSVQVQVNVPVRTPVRVESSVFRLARYATVRHSTNKGARYLLGLEFRD